MKALRTLAYGQPEALGLQELSLRDVGAGEVLVQMRATSLNGSDWEYVTGHPGYTRMYGVRRPRFAAYGSDVAGVVVEVGAQVVDFKAGDRVFGDVLGTFGTLAPRVIASAKHLRRTPAQLDDVRAACLCQSGAIAWQAMQHRGGPPAGARVLIVGGGGGSGMLMIQLAKQRGCAVVAVDHERKLEFMRTLGADEVLDYSRVDLRAIDDRFDYIVDLVAPYPLSVFRQILAQGGTYLVVGGPLRRMLWTAFAGPFARKRTMKVLAIEQNGGLLELAERVVAGELEIAIDRSFPLAQAADALRHLGAGRACGKIVVEMDSST